MRKKGRSSDSPDLLGYRLCEGPHDPNQNRGDRALAPHVTGRKKQWIEQAIGEVLDHIEAAGRELDDFERVQISGALSGALSGLYDFGRCCIALIDTPKDQINMAFNLETICCH